jgi:phage terminase large subunit GpA-like protein
VESEWLKQLVAEELVTVRTKRGFARLEWQKLRERNEALDCRVYTRAAASIVGADRWSEARWVDLETQVAGDGKDDGGQEKAAAGSIRSVRSPARRRSVASNYMR